jgi:ABC-type sugar transport system permease subunit
MGEAIATYLPTLVRYIAVAIGLVLLMYVVYRVQLAIGIKREAATGRALVVPWLVGFLIFNVFTIGSSFYLSFTEYNLFRAPEWIGLENYAELFDVSAGTLQSSEQRSSEVLAPRHDEVLRIQIGDGGWVFGAANEYFWRSVRLTLSFAYRLG